MPKRRMSVVVPEAAADTGITKINENGNNKSTNGNENVRDLVQDLARKIENGKKRATNSNEIFLNLVRKIKAIIPGAVEDPDPLVVSTNENDAEAKDAIHNRNPDRPAVEMKGNVQKIWFKKIKDPILDPKLIDSRGKRLRKFLLRNHQVHRAMEYQLETCG